MREQQSSDKHDRGETNILQRCEPIFQAILSLLDEGENYNSPQMEEQFRVVYPFICEAAQRLLSRRWRHCTAYDSQDATQNWFDYMMNYGFAKYRPNSPFVAFAYWKLRNICIDLARSGRRRKAWQMQYDVADERFNPIRMRRIDDARTRVREQVAFLKPHLKTVIIAQYWNGMSAEQTATAEGITRGSVDSRRHRARGQLRDALDDLRNLDF